MLLPAAYIKSLVKNVYVDIILPPLLHQEHESLLQRQRKEAGCEVRKRYPIACWNSVQTDFIFSILILALLAARYGGTWRQGACTSTTLQHTIIQLQVYIDMSNT
jgi:hypothetical protein